MLIIAQKEEIMNSKRIVLIAFNTFVLGMVISMISTGTNWDSTAVHVSSAFSLGLNILFLEYIGLKGDIRKLLIDDNLLDAVIGLPSNLFLNTQIPVCVLIFKKTRNDKDILFIDASKEFVKEGKQNYLSNDQIEKIKSAYSLRKDIDKFSHVASLEEIEQNDYNLNIPRYVDTSEEKEPVDLAQVVSELVQIEAEIEATEKEFVALLKNALIGYPLD